MTTVGCVLLTMGNRPERLLTAIESVLAQRDVEVDVVVVGNGWRPEGLPDRVGSLWLPDNLGAAAGRNAGVPQVAGDLVLFLDDDAALVGDDFLARAVAKFAADATLGMVQPRPVDPVSGVTPRSFVPRLRVGDPGRSSDVTVVWEGALVVRRAAFDAAGGWAVEFGYHHEGIELGWRVLDAGYRVAYCGDLLAYHDAVATGRMSRYYWLQSRNRVLVARRNLPVPLALLYVFDWLVLTAVRTRSREVMREYAAGVAEGLRVPRGERRRLQWSTLWRMCRLGRPPVV